MSREIKFRAWDDKDKCWLLGYEYSNLGGFSMFGECMLFNEWSDIINRFILNQKDRTEDDLKLMQFTGLKDKNGVDIYEGDIFPSTSDGIKYYKLVFENGGFVLYHNLGYWGTLAKFIEASQKFNFNLEVTGNIYENPQLLTP